MNTSRFTHLTVRAVAVLALLVSAAGAAGAQKAKSQTDEQAAGKSILTLAREDPEMMLKGITLNAIEKKAARDIERRFAREFNALEWEFKAALKEGRKNAPVFAKVEALRSQQRSEFRSMLTKEQQTTFDNNMAGQ